MLSLFITVTAWLALIMLVSGIVQLVLKPRPEQSPQLVAVYQSANDLQRCKGGRSASSYQILSYTSLRTAVSHGIMVVMKEFQV
jgi:uncharacterized membrane protein